MKRVLNEKIQTLFSSQIDKCTKRKKQLVLKDVIPMRQKKLFSFNSVKGINNRICLTFQIINIYFQDLESETTYTEQCYVVARSRKMMNQRGVVRWKFKPTKVEII